MNLSKYLTVCLTTHTNSSTELIENTIASIRKNFLDIEGCKFVIYSDAKYSDGNYHNHLEKLNNIQNVLVHSRPDGLQNNWINGVLESETPFVLNCEHDWIFLREIDTKVLIQSMLDYDFINYVKFNLRDNHSAHKDNPGPKDACFWETYIEPEDRVKNQSLIKTNSIVGHPHIIRKEKIAKDWINIVNNKLPGVLGSVEVNLYDAYTLDINRMGFNEAHKIWGVYNYGSLEDLAIIKHTGNDFVRGKIV